MNLTDQEIETLVTEVAKDVMGTKAFNVLKFRNDKSLTDAIRYPDDPKKQFVLESIVLGASMKDAYDHLSEEEAALRAKILIQFLAQFGIHLTYD